jgi:hypothetical protein
MMLLQPNPVKQQKKKNPQEEITPKYPKVGISTT